MSELSPAKFAFFLNLPWIARLFQCIATASLMAGFAFSQDQPKPDPKLEKQFYTAKDRLQAIRSATLFSPQAIGQLDIAEGPTQKKDEFQLHANDKVICDFVTPGSKMGGNTAKFGCKITRIESSNGQVQTLTAAIKEEDPVKVKYGSGDNEVYAEVAASRLLWALGFYTDSWYPVRVECHGCPADPESGKGATDTRQFDPAIIVRKFQGHKVYEVGNEAQGWSWKELEANGRPTHERDGLALLAAFIVHSDNKPPQQRLACDHVNVDQTTNPFTTTCDHSHLVVQDVGATFGSGGWFTSNDGAKMNLEEWSGNGLWKKVGDGRPNSSACQARLKKSLTAKDGLSDPAVSEEGRRLLAGQMCQLSDTQISALFRLSRVAHMPRYQNSDGTFKNGLTEDGIVQQWVAAFKKKREDLAAGRCRWNAQPPDLKPIDNPAGLATVPNFCSARPY